MNKTWEGYAVFDRDGEIVWETCTEDKEDSIDSFSGTAKAKIAGLTGWKAFQEIGYTVAPVTIIKEASNP